MPKIELTTVIDAPIDICFDLARSIDLHKLSTEGTDEQAIDGVTTGLIGPDEFVTWRARHFGIMQQMTSKITAFYRPNYFRDEMTKGIFKSIKHDHRFEANGSSTEMKDIFEFETPYGILGKLVNWLVLYAYLHSLLEKRNRIIKEVAESGKWKSILNH
jgi:ligand-binding SRPBCC domain-containing protein